MTIDIIEFTDAQYLALNEEQLQEVMKAQTKKEKLLSALNEKKRKEKFRLLKNGVFRSNIYDALCAQWDGEYQAELDTIKERLLFYLRFSVKTETPVEHPYMVDYALSYAERFAQVRDYYLATYSDPTARMDAFKQDAVAPSYLGEYYASLYDYFLDKVEN